MLTTAILGVFASHFWENPSIRDASSFQTDVIEILQYVIRFRSTRRERSTKITASRLYFNTWAGDYFTPQTQLFIMAGTTRAINTNDPDDIATLSQSAPQGPRYTSQVDDIVSVLQVFFPGNQPTVFAYVRQVNPDISLGGAWGKAAVSLVYSGATSPWMLDSLSVLIAKFIR